jgi:hypothetical protein
LYRIFVSIHSTIQSTVNGNKLLVTRFLCYLIFGFGFQHMPRNTKTTVSYQWKPLTQGFINSPFIFWSHVWLEWKFSRKIFSLLKSFAFIDFGTNKCSYFMSWRNRQEHYNFIKNRNFYTHKKIFSKNRHTVYIKLLSHIVRWNQNYQ